MLVTAVLVLCAVSGYSQEDTAYHGYDTTHGVGTTIVMPYVPDTTTHTISKQDSNVVPEVDWAQYATDTSLTYQQIITICDSLFAGMPHEADTSHEEHEDDGDNNPYFQYTHWKQFWETRLDAETGKIYGMRKILALKAARDQDSRLCNGASHLQSSMGTFSPGENVGWHFIGPQNIQNADHGMGLGQVNIIKVNPANPKEVYIVDNWGGLWMTSNAFVANPVWKCLTDNDARLGGIGVSVMDIHFPTSGPAVIVIGAGYPGSPRKPGYFYQKETTAGIYISLNGGAQWGYLEIPATVLDLDDLDEFINDIKFWAGNNASQNYLFFSSKYRITRVNIQNLASEYHSATLSYGPTAAEIVNVFDMQTYVPADHRSDRFTQGMGEITFRRSDPHHMFFVTKGNPGLARALGAHLLEMADCIAAPPSPITDRTALLANSNTDYAAPEGNFNVNNPNNVYQWWFNSAYWQYNPISVSAMPTGGHMELSNTGANVAALPPPSGGFEPATAASFETAVPGNYIGNTTYIISATILVPPNGHVRPVLRDATHNLYGPDWPADLGTGDIPIYNPVYPVYLWNTISYTDPIGSGWPLTPYTFTFPVTLYGGPYVNRLQFLAWFDNATDLGKIYLDDVHIVTEYQDYIYNLRTTPAAGAANDIYSIGVHQYDGAFDPSSVSHNGYGSQYINRTNMVGLINTYLEMPTDPASGSAILIRVHDGLMEPSASVANDVFVGNDQSSGGGTPLNKGVIGVPLSLTDFASSEVSNHPDGRSIAPFGPNDRLYFGNDGGISCYNCDNYPAAPPALTGWRVKNGTGFNSSLPFNIGSSQHTGDVAIGTGDNGIIASNEQSFDTWKRIKDGDGGDAKYGKQYPMRNAMLYTGNYNTGSGAGSPDIEFRSLTSSTTPTITGPTYNPHINGAPLSTIKVTNTGEFFGNSVSGRVMYDRVAGVFPGPYTSTFASLPAFPAGSGKCVQAIAPDMYNSQYMAVLTTNGQQNNVKIYTANDINYIPATATATWVPTGNVPGEPYISTLCADPRSSVPAKRLWAGAAWYRPTTIAGVGVNRVFESVDNGNNWRDISQSSYGNAGLPPGPVNALLYDEQSHYLFAGTDFGVYAYNVDHDIKDRFYTWECYSLNLGNVFVSGLDINRCTGKLYVSCMGRGAYECDLPRAQNWSGAGTGVGDGVSDIGTMEYIAPGTHVLWDKDRDVTKSVYIAGGATLVIRNCTINMGRNKNIIVDSGVGSKATGLSQAGGTLVVQGAKITNECGAMWGMIDILGDPNVDQYQTYVDAPLVWPTGGSYVSGPYANQGLVRLEDWTTPTGTVVHTVLENAYYGIFIGDQIYDGYEVGDYVPGKNGGIARCFNATFHNCMVGMNIHPYKFNDYTIAKGCTFLCDDTLRNFHFRDYTAGATNPRNFASVWGVYCSGDLGLRLMDCIFETRDNTISPHNYHPDFDLRGVGYKGDNSSTSITNCKFIGLTRGIFNSNTVSTWYPDIRNNNFSNCWRAISICNTDQASCSGNVISNGPMINYFPTAMRTGFVVQQGTAIGSELVTSYGAFAKQPFGIYFSQGKSFSIQSNTISGSATASPDYGIIINNTNTAGTATGSANTLFRNSVNNTSFGIVPTKDNRGMQMKCNILNTKDIGIFEDKLAGGGASRISTQGSCAHPAGNVFLTPPLVAPPYPSHITSVGGNVVGELNYTTYSGAPFQPFYYSNYTYEIVPYTFYTTYVPPPMVACGISCPVFNTCCATPTSVRIAGTYVDTSVNDTSMVFAEISVSAASIKLAAVDGSLQADDSLIKTGKKAALLAFVKDTTNPDTTVVAMLQAASPYLADDVLTAAIKRVPKLDFNLLKPILLQNSPLDYKVMGRLKINDTVMAGDSDIINAQTSKPESPRRILEGEISDLSMQQQDLLRALSEYYGQTNNLDKAAKMYVAEQDYERAFAYYMQIGNYTKAQNMVNKVKDGDMQQLLSIHLNCISKKLSVDSLSVEDSAVIAGIAAKYPTSHAGEMARIWYCNAYRLNFYEMMPGDSSYIDTTALGERHSNTNYSSTTKGDEPKKSIVTVFPNPANETVTLRINDGMWLPGSTISAIDMYSRQIFTVSPSYNNGDVQINTQSWTPGIYIFTARLGDGRIFTSKIVIKK